MNLAFAFLLGYLADLLLGDPPSWPHPVRLLGRMIQYWESVCYRNRIAAGVFFWLAVMATTLSFALAVLAAAALLPRLIAIILLAYVCYTGLATRSLHHESLKVETALKDGDLRRARNYLSMIVGRETAQLSPEEIRRAVLETVAENLSDGAVAPMFYLALLGLPGLVLYKAINTMDSMVGYKTERYAKFGRMAARADDVVNFLPARLTALLLVGMAAMLNFNWQKGFQILWRDRNKASSPNAGWPEAALAGALDIQLGGASIYFGQRVDKAIIGGPGEVPASRHYPPAICLLYGTSLIMAVLTLTALLVGGSPWGLLGRMW